MGQTHNTAGTQEMSATEMFENEGSKPFSVKVTIIQKSGDGSARNYRQLLAQHTVKSWSTWAAAAGLIPVPVFDLAAIGVLQVKMIYELCKVYDVPYKKEMVQSLVGGLAGSTLTIVASGYLSARLFRFIPYAGPVLSAVIQPGLAFASTYALGQIFLRHFESGQSLTTVTSESVNSAYHAQLAKSKSLFKKKKNDDVIDVLDPAIHPVQTS